MRSEDKIWGLILLLHHVGPRDQTQESIWKQVFLSAKLSQQPNSYSFKRFFTFIFYVYEYVYGYFAYTHACVSHACLCLQKSDENVRSPGTGVIGLWAAMWVLRIKLAFSGRVANFKQLSYLSNSNFCSL